MSKRKNKKRRGGAENAYQGFTACFAMSGFKNAEAVKQEFRRLDEESFSMGLDDKKSGRQAVPYAEFAEEFSEIQLPPPMLEPLIKANYSAYMDGYRGKEFRPRTIIEEID